MGKIANVQEVPVNKLVPYERNAKIHGTEQVEKLKASIEEFGFLTPCLIDSDYNLIAGHGRLMAAKELNMDSVPCVFIEGLSEEQRRAYILADNKLGELGVWDMVSVDTELRELLDMNFDIETTGFDMPEMDCLWFERNEKDYDARQEGNDEYNEFLDKFEIAKTTDDCYTPQLVFDALEEWVKTEYKIKSDTIRPFYPGGDYQKENYKDKVVIDNPPFSILSEIISWYNEQGIKYFLFAPSVSCFQSKRKACAVCVGVTITYENGAKVPTSFVTNLEGNVARTAPDLYKIVEAADEKNREGMTRHFPSYEYPNEVITAAMMSKLSKYGQKFIIKDEDASEKIGELESQKESGKGIFGGGYFISREKAAEKAAAEKAAAEKAAAEKAAAQVWTLSEKEKEIINSLSNH